MATKKQLLAEIKTYGDTDLSMSNSHDELTEGLDALKAGNEAVAEAEAQSYTPTGHGRCPQCHKLDDHVHRGV